MRTECNYCTRERLAMLAKVWQAEMLVEPLVIVTTPGFSVGANPVTIKFKYRNGGVVWVADLMDVTPQCVCGQISR